MIKSILEKIHALTKPSDFKQKVNNSIGNVVSLNEDLTSSYVRSSILVENFEKRYNTRFKRQTIVSGKNEVISFLKEINPNLEVYELDRNSSILIERTKLGNNLIEIRGPDGNICLLYIYGDDDSVRRYSDLVVNNKNITKSLVKWYHFENGALTNTTLEMGKNNLPIDEMYPGIGKPLEEYYKDFLESKSNILLLIGPPGTGKTTFIRGLIDYSKTVVSMTYDDKVVNTDGVFVDFFNDELSNILLLEDSDTFIKSRDTGNSLMKKFLNTADGICANINKKIIFTTNLPNINDVDPALIRAGRCYDVIHFRKLTIDELKALNNKLGVDKEIREEMTIAEYFSPTPVIVQEVITQKFGFI
jgi:hypothetical protein